MRKRNATKSGSLFQMNFNDEVDVKVDYSSIQAKKHLNSSINNISKSTFSAAIPVENNTIIDEKPEQIEYSYSYSYSDYSDNDQELKDKEVEEMNSLFKQLFDKFGNIDETDKSSQLDVKIEEAKTDLYNIHVEIDEMEKNIGSEATSALWKIKQFFTELINFIDVSTKRNVDLSTVKEEYLSLDSILTKIKSLYNIDPDLYKRCRFADVVLDLFEFFAILEIQEFDFSSNVPLIDQKWIRAGWKWIDDFGNPDIVPKVFEQTCLPILVNKLQSDQQTFPNEDSLRNAFYHCVEICDYCQHSSAADAQLMDVLKKRLEKSFHTGKINYQSYNSMMVDFGFKKVNQWEELL